MVSDSSATTTSYCSTRGGAKGVSFEDVVLGGLAEDRGLYVPEELPTVSGEELSEVTFCVCSLCSTHGRFQELLSRSGGVWSMKSRCFRIRRNPCRTLFFCVFCGATYSFKIPQ